MTRPAPTVTVPVEPDGVSLVYRAAYDSIRNGAPGLSDATCAVIARSINMKVAMLSAPAAPQAAGVGEDELIDRGLRMIRSHDAVRYLRDALSATTARLTGYDWNADPDGVTKQQGDAFSAADRVFADLDAAVASHPEIELPECQACGGTGKIEEAARTEGANQHSACVRTCDDCDGCGFAPDDEPEPLRAPSREPEGGAVDDVQKRVERIVFEDFYGSSVAGSKERLAKALIREFGLAALATREEAPAEAGEWTVEKRFPELNDHLIRMASTGNTGSLTEWAAFWDCLRSALRAQPQSRDDAQPVACRFCDGAGWENDQNWEPRYADVPQEREKGDGLIRCGHCLGDGVDPSPDTHPAPDALRETFEDIKSAADSFRDCEGDEVAHQVIIRCDEALAALQAEQKGGA